MVWGRIRRSSGEESPSLHAHGPPPQAAPLPAEARERLRYKFARPGCSDEHHRSDRALHDSSRAGTDSASAASPVARNALGTALLLDAGTGAIGRGGKREALRGSVMSFLAV